jgi:hypothetical protein
MAAQSYWEEMASKELGGEKTSCVVRSDSKTYEIRCQDKTSERWEH